MVRRTTVSLFCLIFGLVLFAQAPKEQPSSEPTAKAAPPADQNSPAEPPSAKAESTLPKSETGSATTTAAQNPISPIPAGQYPLDVYKNFSAVMTGSLAGDDEESNLYRRGNLMRTDVGNKGNYNVTDLAKGDTFGVTPYGCLHDQHPHFRIFPFRAAMHGEKVERTVTGKEMIDGHSCVVESVTVSSEGPPPRKLRLRMWEAEDLQGFPIKIEVIRPGGKNNAEITYSKVVLTPPDAALFKHPASCQVLSKGPLPGGRVAPGAKTPTVKPPASKSPATKTPSGDPQK